MFNRSYLVGIFYVAGALPIFVGTVCAHDAKKMSGAQRAEFCGIVFPEINGLAIDATLLPDSFATSRVNQERYNACPYAISMKLQGVAMNLDFSGNVTLADINNAHVSGTLHLGPWQYDGNEWKLDPDVFSIPTGLTSVFVRSIDGGVLLSAEASRRSIYNPEKFSDSCFHLALVGATGWAGGMTCSSSSSALAPFRKLVAAPFVLRIPKPSD